MNLFDERLRFFVEEKLHVVHGSRKSIGVLVRDLATGVYGSHCIFKSLICSESSVEEV